MVDPGRVWKGPWRWYDEKQLSCCKPLELVQREGVTLPELACLARCEGARLAGSYKRYVLAPHHGMLALRTLVLRGRAEASPSTPVSYTHLTLPTKA